jgi:hypothetical protein
MWVFAGDSPNQFAFYYHYHPSRGHEVCENFFMDFKGYLHCDGFAAYDISAAKYSDITLTGCMYHARRKFVEVTKLTKSIDGVSHHVLKIYCKISCHRRRNKKVECR